MIRNPIDIATRVSPELSSLIETLIEQSEAGESLTLAAVRLFVVHEFPGEIDPSEIDLDEIDSSEIGEEQLHHFDVDESLIDELDELIEQFGESAAAMDFIYAFASEALTRVIEEVMDDENREGPPTLEDIQEEISGGLGSRLVGEGVLEDDEDDALESEIASLIDRYGPDAMAEDFLRYE